MTPSSSSRLRWRMAIVAALCCSAAAHAQSQRGSGYSVLPYTQQGYVGLNIGASDFSNRCGPSLFDCDNPDAAFHIYTGGLFNQWLGIELGYLHTGNADRAGGRTKAEGVNVSLLARAPLGPVNVFAKAGTTYARTVVSADALSGVPSGRVRAWAPSIGVGAGYDFGSNSSVVLEWNRSNYKFAGVGREAVKTTSLGYVYRF